MNGVGRMDVMIDDEGFFEKSAIVLVAFEYEPTSMTFLPTSMTFNVGVNTLSGASAQSSKREIKNCCRYWSHPLAMILVKNVAKHQHPAPFDTL